MYILNVHSSWSTPIKYLLKWGNTLKCFHFLLCMYRTREPIGPPESHNVLPWREAVGGRVVLTVWQTESCQSSAQGPSGSGGGSPHPHSPQLLLQTLTYPCIPCHHTQTTLPPDFSKGEGGAGREEKFKRWGLQRWNMGCREPLPSTDPHHTTTDLSALLKNIFHFL